MGCGITRTLTDGTYSYIYGTDIVPSTHKFIGMKVARVPLGLTGALSHWQYWNGTTWLAGSLNAVPMGSSNLFTGVIPQPGRPGYESVIKAGGGSAVTIDVSYACSPQGPWSVPPIPVYTVPGVKTYPNEIAYTPTFHPELSGTGGLVISFSINSLNGLNALKQNIHQYQPRFLLLG